MMKKGALEKKCLATRKVFNLEIFESKSENQVWSYRKATKS